MGSGPVEPARTERRLMAGMKKAPESSGKTTEGQSNPGGNPEKNNSNSNRQEGITVSNIIADPTDGVTPERAALLAQGRDLFDRVHAANLKAGRVEEYETDGVMYMRRTDRWDDPAAIAAVHAWVNEAALAAGEAWTRQAPPFPAPKDVAAPAWATVVGEWKGESGAEWVRDLRHPIIEEVHLLAVESYDGETVKHSEPTLDFAIDSFEGSAEEIAAFAREMAAALHQAADLLTGPPRRGEKGSAGAYQARVCARIRKAIEQSPLTQNEIAVEAGYGTNELSDFMVGRLPMDVNDVERIANALGLDPFDIACDEEVAR